ncbi:hypothetical protein M1278_02710 [Candidatus Marsarchaeota archaeon]|nr:hypothetical protein [Candidatus Marsarchaeota archaeon]
MKKANIIIDQYAKVNFNYIKNILTKEGIKPDKINYEFSVIIGGDGTFLDHAIKYNKKPLLFVRKNGEKIGSAKIKHGITASININELETTIKKIKHGSFELINEPVLELNYLNKKYYSACDFYIERNNTRQAIRYKVNILENNTKFIVYGISNGFIITTPLGSTGYYSYIDILNKNKPHKINNGLGFAHILPTKITDIKNNKVLNNPNIRRIFGSKAEITATIIRGNPYLYGINNRKNGMKINDNAKLIFKLIKDKINIIKIID